MRPAAALADRPRPKFGSLRAVSPSASSWRLPYCWESLRPTKMPVRLPASRPAGMPASSSASQTSSSASRCCGSRRIASCGV